MALQIKGLTVFIVECIDGSYYSGMCEDMKKRLKELNECRVEYFMKNPHLVPVKVVFREDHLPFREAYAKHVYLRGMTKKEERKKLIETRRWPLGKSLREFMAKNQII